MASLSGVFDILSDVPFSTVKKALAALELKPNEFVVDTREDEYPPKEVMTIERFDKEANMKLQVTVNKPTNPFLLDKHFLYGKSFPKQFVMFEYKMFPFSLLKNNLQ